MSSVTTLFPNSDDGLPPQPESNKRLSFYTDVALVWSGVLGKEITPQMVALLLAGADLVMVRLEPEVVEHVQDVATHAAAAEDLLS